MEVAPDTLREWNHENERARRAYRQEQGYEPPSGGRYLHQGSSSATLRERLLEVLADLEQANATIARQQAVILMLKRELGQVETPRREERDADGTAQEGGLDQEDRGQHGDPPGDV